MIVFPASCARNSDWIAEQYDADNHNYTDNYDNNDDNDEEDLLFTVLSYPSVSLSKKREDARREMQAQIAKL